MNNNNNNSDTAVTGDREAKFVRGSFSQLENIEVVEENENNPSVQALLERRKKVYDEYVEASKFKKESLEDNPDENLSDERQQQVFRKIFNETLQYQRAILKPTEKCFQLCINGMPTGLELTRNEKLCMKNCSHLHLNTFLLCSRYFLSKAIPQSGKEDFSQ